MIKLDIIKWWAEKLESGEYLQGRGRLRRGNEFDVLGVLCDLGTEGQWIGNHYQSALGGVPFGVSLPPSIRKYIGLPITDLGILMGMNDGGKTFKQIAVWLRKKYLG